MKNNSNQPYFPHYTNARNNAELLRLRMNLGAAGYGVYYMLLEQLRLSDDFQYELSIDILSYEFDCSEELIRSVIFDFGLFNIIETEEGTMFESVELTAYKTFMEEKKAKRAEAARAAANARWGNTTANRQTVTEGSDKPKSNIDVSEKQETIGIDREIEAIKKDEDWLDAIVEESKRSREEVMSYFPEFRRLCIGGGQKEGHKSLQDAMSHFRFWLIKIGRMGERSISESGPGPRATRAQLKEAQRREESERKREIRQQEYQEMQLNKANPNDYIRNKGYDPDIVTMVMLMQPGWTEQNPPTHPEWIGQFNKLNNFEKSLEIPY